MYPRIDDVGLALMKMSNHTSDHTSNHTYFLIISHWRSFKAIIVLEDSALRPKRRILLSWLVSASRYNNPMMNQISFKF
ncbi:CLUMA_CG011591, isoform A [Clunio marinus]|uniref:CLUMA_CG011591, isoform A n=1 Tax=Clunio marinus TaxID=568069 RepID=A0A1J1IFA0_9DIPT|nr:CLUMA_CG011591, isoform A [Clunio marinus]